MFPQQQHLQQKQYINEHTSQHSAYSLGQAKPKNNGLNQKKQSEEKKQEASVKEDLNF